jgi:Fe-S oxidoreductase/nitrate reductase gamma subunit
MPIRETFWNIPHWAEIGQYLLGLLTMVIFGFGVYRRVRRWRLGAPEKRSGQWGKRIWFSFTQSFGQMRTLKDPFAGLMHLSIFWGMFALLLGTILATVDWDVTRLFFNFQFLTGGVYVIYELVLDVLGLLLIVGLGMAVYRRYFRRPRKLSNPAGGRRGIAWDDAYALAILILVAVTGYLVEGLRIAVTRPAWAPWSPVGNAIAGFFSSTGDPANLNLHLGLWIFHTLVAMVFIGSIPFTKLFHLVTAPVNFFFASFEPPGRLSPYGEVKAAGVSRWPEFTWKQIMDFDSCIRCGRCQEHCPAFNSGSALSPRDLMIKLNGHVSMAANGRELIGDTITPEEIWGCVSCRACVEVCPVATDQMSVIIDMRRHLVLESEMDGELQSALTNLARYGNSFGQSERKRALWAKTIEPQIKNARKEPVEYLWYVGDYASYHASMAGPTARTAQLFQAIGLDFGILYADERNSGNDVRRVGEEGLFEMLVEKNTKVLERCEFETILTTDPHTYNTLKNEYPLNGHGNRNVLHYTELLDQLMTQKKLGIKHRLDEKVTYHDPCYLGRYNGLYEVPRRVIRSLGCDLVEMPRTRESALCCGAGGGRIWMEEAGGLQERPAESRVREAAALPGVQTLVVACPKDLVMFQEAVKTAGLEGKLEIKDVIELVAEAVG